MPCAQLAELMEGALCELTRQLICSSSKSISEPAQPTLDAGHPQPSAGAGREHEQRARALRALAKLRAVQGILREAAAGQYHPNAPEAPPGCEKPSFVIDED